MTIEVGPNLWKTDQYNFTWPDKHAKPSIGYKLWYFHLRFSEYYYTAHKVRNHMGLSDREQLLAATTRFHEVLEVYQDFGDVWAGLFETWWEEKGEDLFGIPGTKPEAKTVGFLDQGPVDDRRPIHNSIDDLIESVRTEHNNPDSLLIYIPLTGTQTEIIESIKSILKEQELGNHPHQEYPLNLALRENDLIKGLDIMWSYCNPYFEHYWEIGHKHGIGNIHIEDTSSMSSATMEKKRALGKVTYERIQSIRRVIESAAHGCFPKPKSDIKHLGMRAMREAQLTEEATTYKEALYNRLIEAKFKERADVNARNLDQERFEELEELDDNLRF